VFPKGRTVVKVDNMVFGFRDVHARNLAGREVRKAGYVCHGTGPSSTNQWTFLTIDEPLPLRRTAVAQLIRKTSPTASRLQ
jgi:hypothetical protein